MPFATTAAEDAALDAVVATLPDDGTYRLYDAIPEAATELPVDGGVAAFWAVADAAGVPVYWDDLPSPVTLTAYAPAAHSVTDWAPASGGVVTTTVPVTVGDASFRPALFFRNDF